MLGPVLPAHSKPGIVDQGDGGAGDGAVADTQDSMQQTLTQALEGYGELNVCCVYTAVAVEPDVAAVAVALDAAAAVVADRIVAAKHIQVPPHVGASGSDHVDQSH